MGERSANSSRARRDAFSWSRSSSGSKRASSAASARRSRTFSTRSTTGFSKGRTKDATASGYSTLLTCRRRLAGERLDRDLDRRAGAEDVEDAEGLLLALHLGGRQLLQLEAAGEGGVGVLADDDL